jgi:pimeloyl-ACP methyl ester carboxylesterase
MCGLVRPLRSRGYRVVAFDAPGHGSNRGSSTTMTHFVTALGRVLNEFEPSREIRALVGHSLGGLAAVAALDRPGRRPQCLVLVGAPSNLSQVLRTFTASWGLSSEIEQCIRSNLLVSHGVPIDHWDVRTLGVRNRLPTLVLHDRDDRYVPYTESEIIAQSLGASARVELTNSLGHVRILGDERSTSLIAEFVADTTSAANPFRAALGAAAPL